ncbi:hypothetical protein ACE10Z_10200 [Bradyrhizobium sp. Pha-3]|uniref:hypothetical protein n=1 Tax=Bradyrhizobium sp. Pha-3 TaxID=208375 RepID=UPI0035D48CE7
MLKERTAHEEWIEYPGDCDAGIGGFAAASFFPGNGHEQTAFADRVYFGIAPSVYANHETMTRAISAPRSLIRTIRSPRFARFCIADDVTS